MAAGYLFAWDGRPAFDRGSRRQPIETGHPATFPLAEVTLNKAPARLRGKVGNLVFKKINRRIFATRWAGRSP